MSRDGLRSGDTAAERAAIVERLRELAAQGRDRLQWMTWADGDRAIFAAATIIEEEKGRGFPCSLDACPTTADCVAARRCLGGVRPSERHNCHAHNKPDCDFCLPRVGGVRPSDTDEPRFGCPQCGKAPCRCPSETERHGWKIRRGAAVVECPGCGFAMGIEHESIADESAERPGESFYDCPNCGDARSVASGRVAGR